MQTIRVAGIAIGTALQAFIPPAGAQQPESSHPFEIAGVIGHVTADGTDFNGTKGATGVNGTLRYVLFGHLGLGLGAHYSDHALVNFPEHLHIRVLYGEARYLLPIKNSPITVFGGPRGGWAHEDVTLVTWTTNGWVIGGVAGVDWRLAPQLALEVQLIESAIHLADLRGADGSVMFGTTVNGSSFGLEGGVALRF